MLGLSFKIKKYFYHCINITHRYLISNLIILILSTMRINREFVERNRNEDTYSSRKINKSSNFLFPKFREKRIQKSE